ncbi:ABC transporter permease [Tahibacter amnicola]|uniref:ABC transporter permease n=1 Tax=Tahibacter amnicola TaxID=2976241 RepID=A0ABY6BJS4_9GAMM|nr:ABC transporter permease [Tahibacter amnicola]UXI68635.1 ABC transporter permease [Tahibacter amnicola]
MASESSTWNPYAPLSGRATRQLGLTAVAAVLILWSLISGLELVGPNKLPAPWQVAKAFAYLAWDGENGRSLLLNATMWSVGRVLAAGALVVAIGIPIGVLMGASPRVNAVLSPLVDPFRSAPVVALLPIMVMWFGIGEWMKILFLFVGAVVYLIPMVRDAMQAVPQAYWISARDLGATPWEAVRHAVLPLAMPRIADAVIVGVSVMWTYITVAEYVNAREGLGQLIQNARRFSAMDQVFAGIIVIVAFALLSYQLMRYIKSKMYPWETKL